MCKSEMLEILKIRPICLDFHKISQYCIDIHINRASHSKKFENLKKKFFTFFDPLGAPLVRAHNSGQGRKLKKRLDEVICIVAGTIHAKFDDNRPSSFL